MRLKLQKQVNRVVDGKEYAKWVLVIPPGEVKKLKWTNKTELKCKAEKGKLLVEKE